MALRITLTDNVGRMLGDLNDRRLERVLPEFMRCELELLAARFDRFRTYTATRFASLRELRQMGHPYAKAADPRRPGSRRRPVSGRGPLPAPPWFINRQSGTLLDSWRAVTGRDQGDIVTAVENAADYASFLIQDVRDPEHTGGTKIMINRPVAARVLRDLRNRIRARREEAVRRILG